MTTITSADMFARFEECDLPYAVMPLQSGAAIIVAQRGGRILGPFLPTADGRPAESC